VSVTECVVVTEAPVSLLAVEEAYETSGEYTTFEDPVRSVVQVTVLLVDSAVLVTFEIA
jgi:hypothetical protein